MTVRTRFAPSPTGYLHIGGVRTALFNWLLSRQAGGQFILRIDDTDANRNQQEALQPILDGFRWLGIEWDEGPEVGGPHAPYFQSQRADRYQAAVDALIAGGAAYHDYAKPEEFAQLREAARENKTDFIYDRRWMATNATDHAKFQSEGRKSVVRLKMPREGECRFQDGIRGEMSFAWKGEQDHVIQRDDGSFIYHLASVVDDYDFQITHVVRAIEHLSNTPRQVFIFESLGYPLPQFAHIPFVAEPGSQSKLSKRKIAQYLKNPDFKKLYDRGLAISERIGLVTTPESFNPVLTDFYQKIGFCSEAVLNYLLLLGWSLDDKTEHFNVEEMTRAFSLDRVIKSPASFDPAKLLAFQQHYFNQLDVETRANLVLPFLQQAGLVADPVSEQDLYKVRQVVVSAADRLSMAGDIFDFDYFFVSHDRMRIDEKAFEKRIKNESQALDLLEELMVELEAHEDFSAASLELFLQQFVDVRQLKISHIIHALRIAVTGQPAGFGMFDTLAILGKQECLARLHALVEKKSQIKS